MTSLDVPQLMPQHDAPLLFVEQLQQARMHDDDRGLDAEGKRIGVGPLIDIQLRHRHVQNGAAIDKFRVQALALVSVYPDHIRKAEHLPGPISAKLVELPEYPVEAGGFAQSGESRSIGGVFEGGGGETRKSLTAGHGFGPFWVQGQALHPSN